ncbi:MAG: class I SAM-dependent methyltransferase [Microthrixaceae bacterium]|nr:class I SAM-dependent methyltransferase [Microthrixaceae bacterium]
MPDEPPIPESLRSVLERSRSLGFLGPGDIEQHVRNARCFDPLIPLNADVLDLGSGGGVPGLVLAEERDDLRVVLLDAMSKRIAFLRDAVRVGAWNERVSTRLGRAEELAHDPTLRASFDVVVVRSFAPPAVTAECGVGFLRPGGVLLVSEPTDRRDRWPTEGLSQLGLAAEAGINYKHTRIQALRRVAPLPDSYPRGVGVPARHPLFESH